MERQKKTWIKYIATFILLFVICYLFPYSCDDYDWGSSIGIERLKNWFDGYNGRYFGNIIVIALAHSHLLKGLVMSACLTGLAMLTEKISSCRQAFFVTLMVIALMPFELMRQSVTWTSGFSNYVISAVLTFIYIAYIMPCLEEQPDIERYEKRKYLDSLLLLVLGFLGSLIVEHISLFNFMLGISILIIGYIKFKKVFIQHAAYLIGTVAALLLMFSNSVYGIILSNDDYYRSVASGGLVNRVIDNFVLVYRCGYTCNLLLNALFLVLFIVLLRYYRAGKFQNLALTFMAAHLAASFYYQTGMGGTATTIPLKALFAVLFLLSFAGVVYLTLTLAIQMGIFQKCLFLLVCIPCVTGPLLFISPIGYRCFFITYALQIALLETLASKLPTPAKQQLEKPLFNNIIVSVLLASYVCLLVITIDVRGQEMARIDHVRKDIANGKTTVEVRNIKSNYFWFTNRSDWDPWDESYIEYYGLPDNIKFVDVDEYSKK